MEHYAKITPEGVVLFRDETSMEKGETNWIVSKYMPYPSVFWGTICTALLREGKLGDIKKLIDEKKPDQHSIMEKNLKLEFVGIYDEKEREAYIPAPLDLYVSNKNIVFCGKYQKGKYQLPTKGEGHETFIQAEGKYISLWHFYDYYSEKKYSNISLKGEEEIWEHETRVGIELDKETRMVKESHLYQMQTLRFKKDTLSYVIGYHSENRCQNGLVTLGGERKMAYFTNMEKDKFFDASWDERECKGNRVRMVVITPITLNGPKENNSFQNIFEETEIEVIHMVVGSLETMSGFDMLKGEEKKKKEVIPAGSVFILESNAFKGKSYNKITEKIEEELIKSVDLFYRGFGKFLLADGTE